MAILKNYILYLSDMVENGHLKNTDCFPFISLFQIMMQKYNHHMSFSLYVSALAISDTFALLISTNYTMILGKQAEQLANSVQSCLSSIPEMNKGGNYKFLFLIVKC